MSTPYEWRINDIERAANEAKGRLWKIDSLESDVSRLESRVSHLETELTHACSDYQQLVEIINGRLERLEEQAHPPVDLKPAVEAIVHAVISKKSP